MHPEDKGTFNNLGIAFSRLGDFKTAIIYFTKALEIDRDYTDVRQNLQIALQHTNVFSDPSNSTKDNNLK